MRCLVIAILLAGCGASTASNDRAAAADGRPRLDGVVVLDVSIDAASPDAQEIWRTSERLLEDRGPLPPPDLGLEDYMDWMRGIWAPWLEGRVAIMRDLRERFAALAEVGSSERIFSSVVAGYLYEDFARLIEGLPVPVEVEGDREMSAAFASQLRAQAGPAWARAREAWSRCIDWAPEASEELRDWGDACTRRLAALPDLEEEAGPRPIAWPTECQPENVATVPDGPRPDAIASGPTGRRPVALLFADRGPLTPAERDRVTDAVFARLRRTHRTLRLVPLREVRRARAAAAAGTTQSGTHCQRPPSTLSLLRARHDDLVAGWISADCQERDGERVCTLGVHLGEKDDGTALAFGARLDDVSFAVDDWIAAVALLSEEAATASVFDLVGAGRVAGAVQIRAVTPYGDWAEIDPRAQLSRAAEGLSRCQDEGDVPKSDAPIILDIAPDGAVTDIVIGGGPHGDARHDCITAVLEDLELSAASGERRLTFTLAFYPSAPVALPYRAIERALHPLGLAVADALGDRFLRDAVARCYAGVPTAQEAVASYQATLTVGPDGAVGDVNVVGATIPDGATDAVLQCIRDALSGARFACPPDGRPATVEATLCVGGR
jgi:hypothetical protein